MYLIERIYDGDSDSYDLQIYGAYIYEQEARDAMIEVKLLDEGGVFKYPTKVIILNKAADLLGKMTVWHEIEREELE